LVDVIPEVTVALGVTSFRETDSNKDSVLVTVAVTNSADGVAEALVVTPDEAVVDNVMAPEVDNVVVVVIVEEARSDVRVAV
jgi:hypothetical protein